MGIKIKILRWQNNFIYLHSENTLTPQLNFLIIKLME